MRMRSSVVQFDGNFHLMLTINCFEDSEKPGSRQLFPLGFSRRNGDCSQDPKPLHISQEHQMRLEAQRKEVKVSNILTFH